MRAIIAAVAALGGGAILATGVLSVTTGDASELYWLIVGVVSLRAGVQLARPGTA